MSKLSISLEWFLQEDELKPDVFSKNHKIEINNNYFNAGSAPEYGGKENELNPEQSLAAAISSCHMMTFLALAAKMRWPVKSYKDNAHAFLGKNLKGKICVNKIEQEDQTIEGFNLGTNCGKIAGQSINHCHIHLIPRRTGDVENPQGGVRGVIPSMQHYIRKTK